MASRLKVPAYTVGALPFVFPAIRWLLENVGTNTEWWAAHVQPILEPLIWPVAPAFLLGLLLQDLLNRKSWIRTRWRAWTRTFEVAALNCGYAEDPRRLEVRVRIRFVRKVRAARLTLKVLSCVGVVSGPFVHIIPVEVIASALKDEWRDIVVARLFISYPGWTPLHSSWGPGPPDHTRALVGGSRNIVELRLDGIVVPQRHRFFVANPAFGGPQEMPAIYVQDDDADVFLIRS